jgi:hypothetical protein
VPLARKTAARDRIRVDADSNFEALQHLYARLANSGFVGLSLRPWRHHSSPLVIIDAVATAVLTALGLAAAVFFAAVANCTGGMNRNGAFHTAVGRDGLTTTRLLLRRQRGALHRAAAPGREHHSRVSGSR